MLEVNYAALDIYPVCPYVEAEASQAAVRRLINLVQSGVARLTVLQEIGLLESVRAKNPGPTRDRLESTSPGLGGAGSVIIFWYLPPIR